MTDTPFFSTDSHQSDSLIASEGSLPADSALSVTEFSNAVKGLVEDMFSYTRIRGEISGYKRAPSGHLYLNLKDDRSVLAAVCWKGTAERFSLALEDGMEVIATGRATTFAGQSKYQLVINSIEIAGEGALMALLEKRKKALAAEGLFDHDRKQAIPFLPRVVGIITSPTGAVIKDMIHRFEERCGVHVLLWPVLVQGEKASEQITQAINGFNRFGTEHALPHQMQHPRPDLLIIARGGGSLEDLWAFNEENVVRATADSAIPTISAVGHETDTTLIDYASDRRAPTPTAAAEIAVPVKEELIQTLDMLGERNIIATKRLISNCHERLTQLMRAIIHPKHYLQQQSERLNQSSQRLSGAIRRYLDGKIQTADYLGKLLHSYDYQHTLKRGFAVIRDTNKKPIMSAQSLTDHQMISIEMGDGIKNAIIDEKTTERAQQTPSAKKTSKHSKAKDTSQQDFFSQ